MSLIDQLKHARRVSVPLVAIQTPDPAATMRSVAESLNNGKAAPVVGWDVVRGCWPVNDAGKAVASITGTGEEDETINQPVEVLRIASAKFPARTVLFVCNAHEYLDLPAFRQAVWNLRDQFKVNQRMLILMGPTVELPASLKDDVVVLDESLPAAEELASIVREQDAAACVCGRCGGAEVFDGLECEECKGTGRSHRVMADEETTGRAVAAVRGLSAFAAEQATAMSLRPEGIDLDHLWESKRRQIEQTPGLSVWRGGETFADVGGLDFAKQFLGKILSGARRYNAVVWVDELEKMVAGAEGQLSDSSGVSQGILQALLTHMQNSEARGLIFVGPPGCGKSLLAKATGGEAGVPTISWDSNAMKGSLVGQSLHPDEEIYVCRRKGGAQVERLTIAEFHERFTAGDQHWYTWTVTDGAGTEVARVTNTFKHVRSERFLRIRTRSGRQVVVTEGHSLFRRRAMRNEIAAVAISQSGTSNDWQKAGQNVGRYRDEPVLEEVCGRDLRVGSQIAIARNMFSCPTVTRSVSVGGCEVHIDEDFAQLMGLWMADGSYSQGALRLSLADKDTDSLAFLERVFGRDVFGIYNEKRGRSFDVTFRRNHWTTCAMRLLGMQGGSRKRRCPGWLLGCSSNVIAAFLRGYFSGDGSISGHVLEAGTMSARLADDVLLLLAKIGIFARMRRRYCKRRPINVSATHKPGYYAPEGWQYRITIAKILELQKFRDRVGFIQTYKQSALATAAVRRPCRGYQPGRVFNSVFWDEVESIEEIAGPGYCYDIAVEGTQRFLSGGVVVHNSEGNVRTALKVISAVSDDATLWVATCNSVRGIPTALRRRFGYGTYFVDLPNDQEQLIIWKHYANQYRLSSKATVCKTVDHKEWTGAEIRTCCELAADLGCSLEKASRYIVPVAQSMPAEIEELRKEAEGRYLSASYPSVYRRGGPEAEGSRAIKLEG